MELLYSDFRKKKENFKDDMKSSVLTKVCVRKSTDETVQIIILSFLSSQGHGKVLLCVWHPALFSPVHNHPAVQLLTLMTMMAAIPAVKDTWCCFPVEGV